MHDKDKIPRAVVADKLDLEECSGATEKLAEEISRREDELYAQIAKGIDERLGEAFALHGIDVEQAKNMVGIGRLKCWSAGVHPCLTYVAELDGEKLFAVRIKTDVDSNTSTVSVTSEFI